MANSETLLKELIKTGSRIILDTCVLMEFDIQKLFKKCRKTILQTENPFLIFNGTVRELSRLENNTHINAQTAINAHVAKDFINVAIKEKVINVIDKESSLGGYVDDVIINYIQNILSQESMDYDDWYFVTADLELFDRIEKQAETMKNIHPCRPSWIGMKKYRSLSNQRKSNLKLADQQSSKMGQQIAYYESRFGIEQ